jgi:hypothetical protein
MSRNIIKIINKNIALILTLSIGIAYSTPAVARDIDLSEIEKALGVKMKSECEKPPCPVDVNSQLDKLTHEHAKKENKLSKLTDTQNAIENSKNSPMMKMEQAELIILNKITAKSTRATFNLGEVKFFGNLSIEVHKCVKSTDPFNTNNLMLLTIFDNKIEDDNLSVFHGWIVSANPSISTLEHPVYEVIAVNCIAKDT